jgi:hypothetical protein
MKVLLSICGIGALLLSCAGCTSIADAGIDRPDLTSVHPDKVLYERGLDALNHEKCDVAYLTLQTLTNTYPESDYAAPAKAITAQRSCVVNGGMQWQVPDDAVFLSPLSD